MARFTPSEQWVKDVARQFNLRSNSWPNATLTSVPDLRRPIDVMFFREAVSKRIERWIGTLWTCRVLDDGCELPLVIGGRFTDEFVAGFEEQLSLPAASADGFLSRLATEFRDWAKGSEWEDEYTELFVSTDDQDVILRWDRAKNA